MKKRKRSSLTQKALQALTEAVAKTLAEHRRRGIPIAVWRDGQVVCIPPQESTALGETVIPYRLKSRDTDS